MVRPKSLGKLLPCLLSLALAGPLAAQEKKEARDAKEPTTFKGDARTGVHAWKMEKGSMYRITVKAEGFNPWVQVEMPGNNGNFQPGTVPVLPPLPPLDAPPPPPAKEKSHQILFTPRETKEYKIKVGMLVGGDLGQGPLPYAMTVERALLKPVVDVKDKLEVNEETKRLEKGKSYSINVIGKGFAPELQIISNNNVVSTSRAGRWFGFGPDAEFVATMVFLPSVTANYRIVVGIGNVVAERKIPLTYTMKIAEIKIALTLVEKITSQDKIYLARGTPHKIHTVKLEAGKKYQIDMLGHDKGGLIFDTYLFLEDSAGAVLAEDDDGGEGRNARIIFEPAKTDTYRIIATAFNTAQLGAYTLQVVENPHAIPKVLPKN